MCGAILVLGTFILKDVNREGLKALTDELRSSETTFQIRQDLFDLKVDLETGSKEVTLEISSTDPNELKKNNTFACNWLGQTKERLSNVEALSEAEKRAGGEDQSASVSNLTVRVDKSLVTCDKNESRIDEMQPNAFPGVPGQRPPTPQEVARFIAGEISRAIALGKECGQLEQTTLSNARKLEAAKKKQYDSLSFWSYIFYCSGWLVGLAGQLLGIHDEHPGT